MNPNQTPQWQVLTGLTPEAEEKMSPEDRDAAIRKLLADVERRAQAELDRADKCPGGERTPYWDPVEAACQDLGISRVKLSKYARRLTGIRAQEIGDKLKAKLVRPKIEAVVTEELDFWWKCFGLERCDSANRMLFTDVKRHVERDFREYMKKRMRKDNAPLFALKLGFSNITRLRKACILAFGTTLDALVRQIASDMVQKCLKQRERQLLEEFVARKEKEKKEQAEKANRSAGVPPASAVGKDGAEEEFDLDAPVERVHVPTDAEIDAMEREEEQRILRGDAA
ncbi:MAG TPA: hypothetical protein VEJ63_00290 [Planctomycetota bacterium]|nr:hypothetical protein [Planctomycetota bacterium]